MSHQDIRDALSLQEVKQERTKALPTQCFALRSQHEMPSTSPPSPLAHCPLSAPGLDEELVLPSPAFPG